MEQLDGKRVAMIVAQQFEDSEAIDPKNYIEELGGTVDIIGMEHGEVPGKKGATLTVEKTFDEVSAVDYDALIVPGGGSPEYLRIHDPALDFTKEFVNSGRPVASICHGAQLLISAGVLDGRTITCVNRIRDDVRNAGATYVDEEVVVDGNLISSRTPPDIPAFNDAIARSLIKEHSPA